MKQLIKRVKQAVITFQIKCIDRKYIRLNHDINWYEKALDDGRQCVIRCRSALLQQRSALKMKIRNLENH